MCSLVCLLIAPICANVCHTCHLYVCLIRVVFLAQQAATVCAGAAVVAMGGRKRATRSPPSRSLLEFARSRPTQEVEPTVAAEVLEAANEQKVVAQTSVTETRSEHSTCLDPDNQAVLVDTILFGILGKMTTTDLAAVHSLLWRLTNACKTVCGFRSQQLQHQPATATAKRIGDRRSG